LTVPNDGRSVLVNVDSLQLTDLVTTGVHHVMTAPFPDIASFEHADSFPAGAAPATRFCYSL
jgi:hypothetical protein